MECRGRVVRWVRGLSAATLWLASSCAPAGEDESASSDAAWAPTVDEEAGASMPGDAGATLIDSGPRDGASPGDAAPEDPGDARTADSAAGTPVADAGSEDVLENLRRVCVETINGHRATLGLAPLSRASAVQETCSDQGAKQDADTGRAHGSAGSCSGLGAQNTCPSWRYGPGTRNATLEASLKRCLQQMWDEGEPPVPIPACIADYQNCFLKHGHFINMASTTSRVVACGFHDMGRNTFWMNQDFGR